MHLCNHFGKQKRSLNVVVLFRYLTYYFVYTLLFTSCLQKTSSDLSAANADQGPSEQENFVAMTHSSDNKVCHATMIGPKHAITGALHCGSPYSLSFYSKGKPLKEIGIVKTIKLPVQNPWAYYFVVLELQAEVKEIVLPSIERTGKASNIEFLAYAPSNSAYHSGHKWTLRSFEFNGRDDTDQKTSLTGAPVLDKRNGVLVGIALQNCASEVKFMPLKDIFLDNLLSKPVANFNAKIIKAFQTLGLDPNKKLDPETLKAARNQMLLKNHPDKVGNSEAAKIKTREIYDAYETLVNSIKNQ